MSLVSFYFRITRIEQRPGARTRGMAHGVWLPPEGNDSRPTYSQLFWFDGRTVYDMTQHPNQPVNPPVFSVCSMYHDFSTFWAVDYDVSQQAVNQHDNRDWSPIGFDHGNGSINWVGIGGEQRRLGVQRDQPWARTIFPENHHPSQYSADERYGGLCGELPIIIALLAFSADPGYLHHALNASMQEGLWTHHGYSHGRIDGRGMIVTIYAAPGTSSVRTLQDFETRRIFPA